jgi:hypothetical protein
MKYVKICIMRYILLIIVIPLFLPGCFNLDGHETHITEVCKCEQFSLSENFYIEKKKGSVQACAKKFGDTLKWGFVLDNETCDLFLPFIYDEAKGFKDGLAPVAINKQWGVIDTTGKVIIDYKFADLQQFSDSLAAYMDNHRNWGFINVRGDTIISSRYDYVSDFWANLSFVHNGADGWKIFNAGGGLMPVKIDSLVDGYHSNNRSLAISHGSLKDRSILNEVLKYPFYSNGKKVKVIAFNNKYAIVPDTLKVDLGTLKELSTDMLKPIFSNERSNNQ